MIPIKTLNEDGYVLVLVLIVTSVLLMLGLMTINIAQVNYKMKQLNSQGKKNFYAVEALIEESEMKLHDYVGQAVDYSYESISPELIYEENNKNFKNVYKKEIKKLKNKLEDTNSYSIKTIEGYKVMVEVELKECIGEEAFNLSIISTVKDKKITEKIKTQHKIIIPEYMDYNYNKQLAKRIDWMNYKW